MSIHWQVLVGLITIFVLGLGVGCLVKAVQRAIPLVPPNEKTRKKWQELTAGNEGGAYLRKS